MAALLAASQQTSPEILSNHFGSFSSSRQPTQGNHDAVISGSANLAEGSYDLPVGADAEDRLNAFRSDMAPFFPFVVIPDRVSARELQDRKPFLYMTIMMASLRQGAAQQLTLARRIGDSLSERVLLKGEQNLDLLQGLLVYLAWYHFNISTGAQFSTLLHMALAMVTDLGLGKPAAIKAVKSLGLMTDGKAKTYLKDRHWITTPHTLEERRAFLGCAYLMSL
ncbi:hypothetical protein A1O3_04964 [Capronia epimyces CBS 606.96]|uniref:Uncharacterized protein n=1 Tax=Capronia epimyces CBS 606.96 TaxID=1182542 RepID=W9XUR1_9EURO|nr:uncharacterized protein A1O3_04964 [Capronia epimyces CBS 606.96]EXJ84297.1 hypothetical protein A1O3_04964 [Capronia epimyces CBS 606.96]